MLTSIPKVNGDGDVSRLVALARRISADADKVDAYLRENNLPQPGFEVDAPGDFPSLPADVQQSRQQIVHDALELGRLARGPRETVRWGVWNYLDTLSIQIINSFGIANMVPIEQPILLSELQTKSALSATSLAQVLRHAMTIDIFCEPKPGLIAHTAASRLLAEDKALQDWAGFISEDVFPAGANVLKSLRSYPEATSLTTTGFNFAFNTVNEEPMFVTFGKDPIRAKRMAGAMASLTGGEGYEVSHFVDNYDLSDVDNAGGTLVDIGGSHGFVSVDLAKKWRNMTFVVQDLPKTVESAPKPISDDVSITQRVQLQAHDFFHEQPVKGADVYYFRWIIHNYSTPYAINIIKNLIPALKPGARIIINDHCLREPGSEKPWDEKVIRGMDLIMLTLLNAQERNEEQFKELFRAAHEGFVFKGVSRSPGCRMSVVEAVWDPKPEVNGTAKTQNLEGRATQYPFSEIKTPAPSLRYF
ncbi:related to sterigmatocystin 7-O-methyltransferase precursor [Claviceps purpurea 20.1]|uniref:Related to sterigmatocystin 7-O-methyltransferase n=1 Tax=Claviceps purpurea (strain 20.1) TaxID=1111077 RepID=M1W413_CLAP2|nr:related to sterigmatocystin 7-O-methyltransferase precursor [Claviceps purpurea 20.1]